MCFILLCFLSCYVIISLGNRELIFVCFCCVLNIMSLLSSVDFPSRCLGLVYSIRLLRYLVIHTYLFKDAVNLKSQVVNLNVKDAVLLKFN